MQILARFAVRKHQAAAAPLKIGQAGGAVLLLLLLVGTTWATWIYFTERVPGGNDFLAHYSVWQAYFRYGYSPYSDQAARYTQELIYGRDALPGEDQNRLTYPFYSLIVHAPFIMIQYPLARAVYMTLLESSLVAAVWLNMTILGWKPKAWVLGPTVAWTLLFYPQARGIILGQFAILGYFSLAACLFLLWKRKDFLAGTALVVSTIKPTLVFLVIPFLLIYSTARRRYSFLAGFLLTLGALMVASFLIHPTWWSEWLQRMVLYSDYTVGQSPVWIVSHQVAPSLGTAGEVILVLLLLGGLAWTWWRVVPGHREEEFYWALALTLVVSNLVVPRSATTNYVMLLTAALWIFGALYRQGNWGRVAVILCMLFSLTGYWWLHAATVAGNQEQAVMFFPYPLIIGAILLAGRSWLKMTSPRFDGGT